MTESEADRWLSPGLNGDDIWTGNSGPSVRQGGYLAPRDAREERLCRLWAEVLELERVGVTDNFFELGGDSLRVVALVSRSGANDFEQAFRALLEQPTVAGWAASLTFADDQPNDPGRAAGADSGLDVAIRQDFADRQLEADPSRSAEWFAMMARTLAGADTATRPPGPVPRRPGRGVPASLEQEEYYIDYLRGRPPRRMPLALRIEGPLVESAVRLTLEEMVRRHEVLRTTIGMFEGEVRQVIDEQNQLAFETANLAEAADRDSWVRSERLAAARRTNDLERGPMVWAKLLRLGADDHVLLLTINHMTLDGWALNLAAKECAELYEKFKNGESLPPVPPRVQYADYAVWQRRRLLGDLHQEYLRYWREQLLAGLRARGDLPTDRPRGGSKPETRNLPIRLDAKLVGSVKKWSGRSGSSLFAALLAAWNLVLSRYTGQQDLAVGSVFANRTWRGAESLLGLCATTEILRLRISSGMTIADLLDDARMALLGAQRYQGLPPHRILDGLSSRGEEGHRARAALYPATFLLFFSHVPSTTSAPPELHVGSLPDEDAIIVAASDVLYENDDIALILNEGSGGDLGGFMVYRRDLFDEERIVAMVGHFENALRAFVARRPTALVAEIDLLAPQERRHILQELNETDVVSPPAGATALDLFTRHLRLAPTAPAIERGSEMTTFAELDRAARAIAARLRRAGIESGDLVGLCARPGLAAVAGVLGIWKAGAAYWATDPGQTSALGREVGDLKVTAFLTETSLRRNVDGLGLPVVIIDQGGESIAPPDTTAPQSVGPGSLAAVVRTPGRDQGVARYSQGALENWLSGLGQVCPPEDAARVLHLTPPHNVPWLWETLGTLASGGTIVLPPEGGGADAALLRLVINERRVTALRLVDGSPLSRLLPSEPAACPSVRRLFLEGRPQQKERPFESPFSRAVTTFLYAPTGMGIDVYAWTESASEAGPRGVGGPLANTTLYLLDAEGHPTPLGVPGEVWVGGGSLPHQAPGNGTPARHALFAEGPKQGGSLLWRTGDEGYWGRDGLLHLGRPGIA
jgi:non-ribosomal peptide synthetase component F/aryl carrier-like protein